jgi:hypothetical protein
LKKWTVKRKIILIDVIAPIHVQKRVFAAIASHTTADWDNFQHATFLMILKADTIGLLKILLEFTNREETF